MAVVAHTEVTKRLPIGDRILIVLENSGSLAAASATEWIATGLSWIEAVVGEPVVKGAAPFADVSTSADPVSCNVVLNAQGTGVAAGTNPGDLGIEVPQTGKTVQVTVIGRP